MPSARVHEAIIKEFNKDKQYNELLLRIGTVAPDSWRNAQVHTKNKNKYLTHFWDFRIKEGQANDYEDFYLKYYNNMNNPFYLGYLIHLIVDQYWKTNIDSKYIMIKDGVKGYRLKDGSFHSDENHFGHYDGIKIQKQLAKKYNLTLLPINQEEIKNFNCNIDELDITGLFGPNGTLNYINTDLSPSDNDLESEIYDINVVIEDIKETASFVKKELKRLKHLKEENLKKINIAVDIDDTILSTKELKDYYWDKFVNDNSDLDISKNDKKFWNKYCDSIALADIKPGVSDSLKKLIAKGYKVDLVSDRPIHKYVSLKQKLVEYFIENDICYHYINLGFDSKIEFLKHHDYDILIDNDIDNMNKASLIGITPILYGNDLNYKGYQTDNWNDIPKLIDKIIKDNNFHKGDKL